MASKRTDSEGKAVRERASAVRAVAGMITGVLSAVAAAMLLGVPELGASPCVILHVWALLACSALGAVVVIVRGKHHRIVAVCNSLLAAVSVGVVAFVWFMNHRA
ncbi:MAG TPA: hypothetical protein VF384_18155 [Planctomycetota bacterium]